MATSSNSFTVSLLVNGITYRITASNGSVDIGSDVSQVNYSSTFQFWQQEAGQSTKSFSCYYAVFTKKGSSYSLIASGGKATSYSLPSRTVYRDGANAIDAFVVCIYDSSHTTHSGYLIELEIPVNRQGNTGEPNISYELTPNVDKIHFKANGNAYSPSSQSLYCGYVKKVGTNDETHVGTNANQIDKSLNSNVFTVFYRFLKTDGTYTTPAKNSSLTNCTLSITSSTPYVSVEFILVDDTTYNANKVITNIAIPISKDGLQGKMGRNLYYAGDSAELAGTTFTVTDTSAPYVSVVSSNGTTCYAFKGENGTYTFPSSSAGYPGTDWEQMFNMKYFISEAIFSNFAKLGSAIFNEDYMFSQYGELVDSKTTLVTTNANFYKYLDVTDIHADKIIENTIQEASLTVSNNSSSYSTSYRLRIGTPAAGKGIIVRGNDTIGGGSLKLQIMNASMANPVDTEKTISATGTFTYRFIATGEELYLYYRKTSSSTVKISNVIYSDCKFRPNIYADWMKGFLYAQSGRFRDVTIEGRINNLITVIDWENNIGKDKIITAYYNNSGAYNAEDPYTQSGSYPNARYYIDVLSCGDFVHIKSLPVQTTPGLLYRLPYYAFSDLQDRGHTIDLTGEKHPMSADDLRKMVGRRITFKIDEDLYNCYLGGLFNLTPYGNNDSTRIQHIANARQFFVTPNNSNKADAQMYPQLIHVEFRQTVWDNYSGFGYVWTGQTGIGSDGFTDTLDEDWT